MIKGGASPFTWLNRDLRWIMVGRVFRSLSQGYLGVIVSLYLLQIGFNAVSLGELFTISAIVSALLTIAVSLLADQIGRKPFLFGFPFLTAVCALIFINTRNFWVIVVVGALGTIARGVGGAGAAGSGGPFYPAEQALCADHAPVDHRNDVFAALSMTDTLGSTIGALLAAVPDLLVAQAGYTPADSYKPLFVLTTVLSILGALSVVPVRETLRRRAKTDKPRSILPRQSRNVIARLALTNLTNGIGVGFYAPFVAYYLYQRFGVGSGTIGFLFAAVNLAATVPYLLSPWLARKMGVVNAVVAIRAIGVVTLGILPLMPTFPLAAAVYFFRMTMQRASIPLRQSYSMGVVAKEERSAAAGLSNLPSQFAAAASPLMAGYLFQTVSLELPFEIGTALQLLNAALFYTLFRNIRPPEEKAKEEVTASQMISPSPMVVRPPE
ncbi:MAG TPA: MFS transporter [Chloroflexota bacterium]|nr:MFS transporter [Chloroflexota bacterium]